MILDAYANSPLRREAFIDLLTERHRREMAWYREARSSWRALRATTHTNLIHQWKHGATERHRTCSILSEAELSRLERELSDRAFLWIDRHADSVRVVMDGQTRHVRIADSSRCGSSTCRVGDPFGCSASRLRSHAERTRLMVSDWIRGDVRRIDDYLLTSRRSAAVGLFQVTGAPGEPLAQLLADEHRAFTAGVAGSGHYRDRRGAGLGGYLCEIVVSRDPDADRWVVVRWMVLALRSNRTPDRDLMPRLRRAWLDRMTAPGREPFINAFTLADVGDARAIGQLITNAVGRLDRPHARLTDYWRGFRLIEDNSLASLWHSGGPRWDELVAAMHGHRSWLVSASADDDDAWRSAKARADLIEELIPPRRPSRPEIRWVPADEYEELVVSGEEWTYLEQPPGMKLTGSGKPAPR